MVSGYRRDVYIPEEWKGKRLLLTIDGAAHESEVYWNGKKIGEHHCGYTAFTMDISDDAVYGILQHAGGQGGQQGEREYTAVWVCD